MQSSTQRLCPTDTLPYLSSGFVAKWGQTKLSDIYPLLNEQKVLTAIGPQADDMNTSAQSHLRDAFTNLCTSVDQASRTEFLDVVRHSLDDSIRFLFSPLPSVQQNTLVLPTQEGVQHLPLPSYYQEPPIRTLVKEVHSMQFYALLSALQDIFSNYSTAVAIPSPRQHQAGQSPSQSVAQIPLSLIARMKAKFHQKPPVELSSISHTPKNCLSIHTDSNGFCFVGYFNHKGLLHSINGENAVVINTLHRDATLVAPFHNGLAQGNGVYRDPSSHTLRAPFKDGLANGKALYITNLWQHVLIGDVVNGAFQNYQKIAQVRLPHQEKNISTQRQEDEHATDFTCEIGDYVDGTQLIQSQEALSAIPLLPKAFRECPVDDKGNIVKARLVFQTASGVLIGTRQRCSSRTTEFHIKNQHLDRLHWATPTMISGRLPRAPAEMSDKKKALDEAKVAKSDK